MARARVAKRERAALVGLVAGSKRRLEAERSLDELAGLAQAAGAEVVLRVLQERAKPDASTFLGSGKIKTLAASCAETRADLVVFDNELTPAQLRQIEEEVGCKIIDRTQLILDIFAQRAQSKDGKLQVELAQLKYSLPRLGQKDDSLSRLTGGIGGRGPGETKLEIGRRRAKERVSHLEDQLKTLTKQRQQRRRRRDRLEVPIVAIVGYTNAGKSTLLNTLTYSDVLAEDKLFATLDTRSRRLRFPEEREVVITDTVGFIRDLPKDLFAAFRATFEETADADLILHVVDAADAAKQKHIETTEKLLSELSLEGIARLLVFNKIDLISPPEAEAMRRQHPDAMFISAMNRETTRALLDRIAALLAHRWAEAAQVPHEPAAVVEEDAPHEASESEADENSLTTLEELVGKSRRSRHRSQAPV